VPLTDNMNELKLFTYLIAEIFECEGDKFTLGHSSHAKVEPCPIVGSVHVWASIAGHPDVEIVLLEAPGCP